MSRTPSESSAAVYVARQPILDDNGNLFGYELLYRGNPSDPSCTVQSDLASARVLTSAVLDLGLDTLTGGHKAFLNVTGELLLDSIDMLVPSTDVVFELLETIEVTGEIVAVCRRLKDKGYLLALDDFVEGSDAETLLPYVSFVKVDVLTTPVDAAARLAERLRPSGVTMLAEKVEDHDMYQHMRHASYSLFQGYYFCRPVIQPGMAIPGQRLVYLRLLAALNKPDLSTLELEALVKQDASLSLRVLRFVNSAAVPTRTQVGTIREALFLIGMAPIRKWASVWCVAGLNTGGTSEVATLALVRARACELLGEALAGEDGAELFLVGLCSLLDVMLSRPIAEVMESLPLSAKAVEALLGQPTTARRVLDAVIAYESGQWDTVMEATQRIGVTVSVLREAYTSALRWAREVGGLASR